MKTVDALCSLKLECEKLVSEKTEMQRHYVMVSCPCPAPLPPQHILPASLRRGAGLWHPKGPTQRDSSHPEPPLPGRVPGLGGGAGGCES